MPEIVENKSLPNVGLYRRHKASIDALVAKYPIRRSMLLPVLWIIQEEDGWISPESMQEAAALCECTAAEVLEVVSFYQMYSRAPLGKYIFGICGTLPCALCAADGLYEYVSEKLGIEWEETTADGMFTIQRRECLGACSEAPVMLLNKEMETKLTREKIDKIIEECRAGKRKPYYTGRAGSGK
jgi:NADH-quinone oxidoreductase subunit E